MKTERKEYLLKHYQDWIEITTNPRHKRYAEDMLNALLDDTFEIAVRDSSNKAKKIYCKRLDVMFDTMVQAAQYFGVSRDHIRRNFKDYDLQVYY